MYIRNFTELFREYLTLLMDLKKPQNVYVKAQLEIRKNTVYKKLECIGKTSNVYKVTANVVIDQKIDYITEYLVDIRPEDIPLILRFKYKTKEIHNITCEQLISKKL